MITAKTKILMVIGDPIEHSRSPKIFNGAFRDLNWEHFVYIAANVKPEMLKEAVSGFRALNIRGVSVTIPHKTEIFQYLDIIDPAAKKIGAVNTIVNDQGKLTGYNTDYLGIIRPLAKRIDLKGKYVGVLGAGGAARAAVYAAKEAGSQVLIFNRTAEKALSLAEEFGGSGFGLEAIGAIKSCDVLINTTAVGMHGENDPIIPEKSVRDGQIFFDIVYNQKSTAFLQLAEKHKLETIAGEEMFLEQAAEQFYLYTGEKVTTQFLRRFF